MKVSQRGAGVGTRRIDALTADVLGSIIRSSQPGSRALLERRGAHLRHGALYKSTPRRRPPQRYLWVFQGDRYLWVFQGDRYLWVFQGDRMLQAPPLASHCGYSRAVCLSDVGEQRETEVKHGDFAKRSSCYLSLCYST
ncbi:hypothetical protein EYF80_043749 [Liparis tanakae]|uniref:Uncharacterized protein n=1 Tax=Liparis tanakae TaxID=230148 RepID=A0A4Z2FYR9_9TELE|nr:hypothetical protein EYF80_043749 [Liparis tanakae]